MTIINPRLLPTARRMFARALELRAALDARPLSDDEHSELSESVDQVEEICGHRPWMPSPFDAYAPMPDWHQNPADWQYALALRAELMG